MLGEAVAEVILVVKSTSWVLCGSYSVVEVRVVGRVYGDVVLGIESVPHVDWVALAVAVA